MKISFQRERRVQFENYNFGLGGDVDSSSIDVRQSCQHGLLREIFMFVKLKKKAKIVQIICRIELCISDMHIKIHFPS